MQRPDLRIITLFFCLSLAFGGMYCTEAPDTSDASTDTQDTGAGASEDGGEASGDAGQPGRDVCLTDADCNYNGMCSDGVCTCTTPWHGNQCQYLTMGTVNKDVYGYRQGFPYTTSWGGSVQYDDVSEQYIMAVSEYVEECANWGWNSTVVIATSARAEGPYTRQFRLFGVMSHEAMFARSPDGDWVLYFTASVSTGGVPAAGDASYDASEVCTRSSYTSPCTCPDDPDKGSNDPTWMSHTRTPLVASSWSRPVQVFDPGNHFTNIQPDGTRAESIDANFNGLILPDGGFVGLWRTWACVGDLVPPWSETLAGASNDSCFSVPHSIRTPDWTDPAAYAAMIPTDKNSLAWLFSEQYRGGPVERTVGGIEDPMIYQDTRTPPVYHAIFHEMFDPQDNVSHAYSTDGEDWTYSGPVFALNEDESQPRVAFTDGTSMGLACERPQLILNGGQPTHIVIGGIPKALPIDSTMDALDNADAYGWPGGATMVIPLVAAE